MRTSLLKSLFNLFLFGFLHFQTGSSSAVIRAKIELRETFLVEELSSISTMELAWEGYPWGKRIRLPDGEVITFDQEFFCARVAETNDLKSLSSP